MAPFLQAGQFWRAQETSLHNLIDESLSRHARSTILQCEASNFHSIVTFTIRSKIHKMLQRVMKTTTVQATSSLGESRMRHLASFHKIAIFGDPLSCANRVQVIPVVFCWTMTPRTSSGMNRLFSAGLGRNGRLASWAVALTAFVSSGF
jgi:hypothetical protein